MTTNTVVSNGITYSLDDFPFIVCAKYGMRTGQYIALQLRTEMTEPGIHLDDSLYDIVEQYLASHTEKKIGYDGCCYIYPASSIDWSLLA